LIATLEMLRDQRLRPTHNLQKIDPACVGLRHIQTTTEIRFDSFLKNSFAFGGINSAIACTAWR
jgi:3-oxoacyl-[acyl-carrier-protein] synthase II